MSTQTEPYEIIRGVPRLGWSNNIRCYTVYHGLEACCHPSFRWLSGNLLGYRKYIESSIPRNSYNIWNVLANIFVFQVLRSRKYALLNKFNKRRIFNISDFFFALCHPNFLILGGMDWDYFVRLWARFLLALLHAVSKFRMLWIKKWEPSLVTQLLGLLIAFCGCATSYPYCANEDIESSVDFTRRVFLLFIVGVLADVAASSVLNSNFHMDITDPFLNRIVNVILDILQHRPSMHFSLYAGVTSTGIMSSLSGDTHIGKVFAFWLCVVMIAFTAAVLIGQSMWNVLSNQTPPEAGQQSHYDILGIDRAASGTAIKRAFRMKVLKNHPDRNPGCNLARSMLRKVLTAYEILSDEERRQEYDETGRNENLNIGIASLFQSAAEIGSIIGEITGIQLKKIPNTVLSEIKNIMSHAGHAGNIHTLNERFPAVTDKIAPGKAVHTSFDPSPNDFLRGFLLTLKAVPRDLAFVVFGKDGVQKYQVDGRKTQTGSITKPIAFLRHHSPTLYSFDGTPVLFDLTPITAFLDSLNFAGISIAKWLPQGGHIFSVYNGGMALPEDIDIHYYPMSNDRKNLVDTMITKQEEIEKIVRKIKEKTEQFQDFKRKKDEMKAKITVHDNELLDAMNEFEETLLLLRTN
ncbi:hypothetical protein CAEBREN_22192 [Caenorhabditis brenneri]|uniref:J domain-containing protein n=1 Tax=Caenorhabditis brenneri TaxID=135651 RepID=G0MBR3_CAEBE|nr:hypothetical protein CAEBREN_22192 [Caenorhabditis brenneri]